MRSLSGGKIQHVAELRVATRHCRCVRGFFSTQAGFRTHDVKLSMLSPGWNAVSFRALDGLNSFNLIYIFYPSPISPSPQTLSPNALKFVASLDKVAAATCAPSPQPPSTPSSSPPPPLTPPSPPQLFFRENHCVFRCPASPDVQPGGRGRTLIAMTTRNGWAHTQVQRWLCLRHFSRVPRLVRQCLRDICCCRWPLLPFIATPTHLIC